MYQDNDKSLMLYACGWQEPDSIPSNVVIKKRKDSGRQNNGGDCAACYCGGYYYPVDGAYYSDAPLFDGDAGDVEVEN